MLLPPSAAAHKPRPACRESVGLTRCLLDIRLPLGDVFHDLLYLLLVIGMVEYS